MSEVCYLRYKKGLEQKKVVQMLMFAMQKKNLEEQI